MRGGRSSRRSSARQDAIRKSLDDAQQAKQELERLHVESQRILAEARERGRSDPVAHALGRQPVPRRAEAEGAGRGRRHRQERRTQIELETARALQQIRTEAVDFSVAIASKLLERNVSKEDNERLIEETFKQIEDRRPN